MDPLTRNSAAATRWPVPFLALVAAPALLLAGAAPAGAQCWQINPTAEMTASDPEPMSLFGAAVAISSGGGGSTAVIGAPEKAQNKAQEMGAVYIMVRSGGGGGWTQQAKLLAGDPNADDHFGAAVAISSSGDTVVIGAPQEGSAFNTQQGAVYVFTRSGTTWSQQAKLVASDRANNDHFGWSVSMLGDTIVVGAPHCNVGGITDTGAAYIFTRSGTPPTWTQSIKLITSDRAANNRLGWSVALTNTGTVTSQQVALVGAPFTGDGAGSVYSFRQEPIVGGTTWTERAKLLAAAGTPEDRFGSSLSASGTTLAVGAPRDDSNGLEAGSAYIFTTGTTGLTWTQQARLLPSFIDQEGHFGSSVSIVPGTLVVGAEVENISQPFSNKGAAYVFTGSGASWQNRTRLVAADADIDRWFGIGVGISGSSVVIGSSGDPTLGAQITWPGAAYFYDIRSLSITQQPVPATACLTGAASFSVGVSGTSPISYQWRHNGAAVAGATSPTYSIASAAMRDRGTYECIITNSCTTLTSASAVLTVNGHDPSCDGLATPADVGIFVNLWFDSLTTPNPAADFDGNGLSQPVDIALFVNEWFGSL